MPGAPSWDALPSHLPLLAQSVATAALQQLLPFPPCGAQSASMGVHVTFSLADLQGPLGVGAQKTAAPG